MRRCGPFLFFLLPCLAFAQGGFGGSLGGAQGGIQGPLGGEAARTRPEFLDGNLWTTRTAIVTPGDRVEYKLTVKKGQAIFAAAESDAFDPALAVEDAKGKTLGKNDDRVEGDQSPFLTFRFPEDGVYTLKVLGFRSAAGGRFTLRTRILSPFDVALTPEIQVAKADDPREPGRTTFRLALKSGQIVDLRRAWVREPNGGRGPMGIVRIVGPTGVAEKDLERVETDEGSPDFVFTAKSDGDYYLDYGSERPARVETDFREVAVVKATTMGEVPLEFSGGELKIVEFPVKPDLIVWTKIEGKSLIARLTAPAGVGETVADDLTHGSDERWSWFLPNRDHGDPDLDQVHVFQGTGTARFAIRSLTDEAQRVVMRNTEALPAFPEGETITGKLDIGEARLFVLPAKRSEIMKVMAKADAFQIRLDLYRLSGGVEQTFMDRSRRSAGGDLYFDEPRTLVARITCDGYGGSGQYTLRRDTASPVVYALGSVQAASPGSAGFTLYSVDFVAGKGYQMTVEGQAPGLTVLDDEGRTLPMQNVSFGGTQVVYFAPERTGRYRLWWRGSGGSWRFQIQPYVPPKVGEPG